jgi:hypothetical protein
MQQSITGPLESFVRELDETLQRVTLLRPAMVICVRLRHVWLTLRIYSRHGAQIMRVIMQRLGVVEI